MLSVIWYHLYILKNLKKKKQPATLLKVALRHRCFSRLNKWHQIEESITYPFRVLRKLKVAFYFFIGCRVQNLKS